VLLLAIETAGIACSVAVFDSDRQTMIASVSEDLGRGHAERLMSMIDEVLAAAQVDMADVERIAVCTGPGSFTGIRVGLAAARGFALALNIPVVGVSTLSILARMAQTLHPGHSVTIAMDAKRNDVFCQTFGSDGEPMDAPQVLSVDDLKRLADDSDMRFFGSGAALVASPETGTKPDHFALEALAFLGARANPVSDKASPLYLRAPDAKPQTGFAVSRK
jgi:N6-L-threonylcarbamoyladenine synthase